MRNIESARRPVQQRALVCGAFCMLFVHGGHSVRRLSVKQSKQSFKQSIPIRCFISRSLSPNHRIDKYRFVSSFRTKPPPPRSLHRRSWRRRLRRGAAELTSGAMAHGAGGFAAAALGHHHRRPQPGRRCRQRGARCWQDGNENAARTACQPARRRGAGAVAAALCHRRRRRREQRRGQCACHLRSLALALVP